MPSIQPFDEHLHRFAHRFASPLREQMLATIETLIAGEFSATVAHLPTLVSDIIPISAAEAQQLGLANVYLWWYYAVQDQLLDGSHNTAPLLGAHLALIEAISIYQRLGITQSEACWETFQRLTQRSAQSHEAELRTRFAHLHEITTAHLAPFTVAFCAERAAPLVFFVAAQAHLAGSEASDPRATAISDAILSFASARQIGDDAGDWADDLRNGQLNFVSARLIGHYIETHQPEDRLDLQRLHGVQALAEACWQTIEHASEAALTNALNLLAPYHPCNLETLIERQQVANREAWRMLRQQRATLQALVHSTG